MMPSPSTTRPMTGASATGSPPSGDRLVRSSRSSATGRARSSFPTLASLLARVLLFLPASGEGAGSAWLPSRRISAADFALLGIIWRDVIFSVLWLVAFALALQKVGRRARGERSCSP